MKFTKFTLPAPPVTKTLMIVISTIFFLRLLIEPFQDFLVRYCALHVPYYLSDGPLYQGEFLHNDYFKPWQIITSLFIEVDALSLIVGMLLLWVFGSLLERTLGSKFFALFFLACGIVYSLTQIFVHAFFIPLDDYFCFAGCSRVCIATFIAFAILFPKSHVYLLIPPIRLTAKWAAIILFFFTLFFAMFTKLNITEWGTIGSMISSPLCIYIWSLWYRRSHRDEFEDYESDGYEYYEMR